MSVEGTDVKQLKKMKTKVIFKSVLVIVCLLLQCNLQAQDVITKKDGSEIKAKVTEVGTNAVKYTRFGTTSPIYSLSKSEIFMIKYEDGEKDVFGQSNSSQSGRRNNNAPQGNGGTRTQQGYGNRPSASNQDEQYRQDIVGTYVYIKTEDNADGMMSLEGQEQFFENGRVETTGVIIISFKNIENIGKATLKYNFSIKGAYEIKSSTIVYDYDINSVEFIPVKTASTTATEEMLYTLMGDQMVPELKKTLINEDSNDKIIELNASRLVVESSKGERSTFKRVKTNF